MASLGVRRRVHVSNRATEAPAQRAEKGEVRQPLAPVFAPGHESRRHAGQCTGEHSSVFVAIVTANAPANG